MFPLLSHKWWSTGEYGGTWPYLSGPLSCSRASIWSIAAGTWQTFSIVDKNNGKFSWQSAFWNKIPWFFPDFWPKIKFPTFPWPLCFSLFSLFSLFSILCGNPAACVLVHVVGKRKTRLPQYCCSGLLSDVVLYCYKCIHIKCLCILNVLSLMMASHMTRGSCAVGPRRFDPTLADTIVTNTIEMRAFLSSNNVKI